MKMNWFLRVALILGVSATAYADRVLDRTEALGILQKLSATPTQTWISAGTIEANHQEHQAPKVVDAAQIDAEVQQRVSEYTANPTAGGQKSAELQKLTLEALPFNVRYELGNEYDMISNVTVKYDGDKFYWEINVLSRTDSVTLPADLSGNYAAKAFNTKWNGHRIFSWDGQSYTIYTALANQAIVDAAGTLPHSVNGPLTAGIIPWGYGMLTNKNLASATITAAEATRDGTTQIEMTVQPSDGSTMTFVLDPAKDYAPTAYTWRGNLNKTMSNYYSGHQKVAGKWVPTTIVTEQRDVGANRLLRSDTWNFTRIDTTTPRDFSVAFSAGARVEYHSPVSSAPAVYNYSNMVNTDKLLADHIALAAQKGAVPANCGTAALKYAASSLGKSISDKDLAGLVGPDGQTSLAALKQAAQNRGLNARAVKTDLATLRSLESCKAILYMPAKSHFVVLDSIAGQDAWLVDLSENKFYYRTSADLLPMSWSGGVALLLSTQPIEGPLSDIDSTSLGTIVGGSGGWFCGLLLQDTEVYLCQYIPPPIGCQGVFQFYWQRWGCEPARDGTCSEQDMFWWAEAGCINRLPDGCTLTSEYDLYYILACM